MTVKNFLNYWRTTAERDLNVAEDLFKLGRYSYCLFFSHLALEKLLKGLVFKKTNAHAPPIHNLVRLAQQAGLDLTYDQKKELFEITSWNIETRYDSYKLEFYKKANKEFTSAWFSKAKEFYTWIKNQF